jgi:hypothetical protein
MPDPDPPAPRPRLVDAFHAGKVPLPVRQQGARGELPVSSQERIQILALLARGQDEVLRAMALQTLAACDEHALLAALADPQIPEEASDFLTEYLLSDSQRLRRPRSDAATPPPDSSAKTGEPGTTRPVDDAEPGVARAGPEAAALAEPSSAEPERQTLLQRIQGMTPAEKIRTALLGNQEERLILIRDSNKSVARAVLQSPKLSDLEVEAFASMKNVTEEVLRLIALNRKFMKNYSVVRALAFNPRCPIDVGLNLIKRLQERDLKWLAKNKNVAETVRTAASKLVSTRQPNR